MRRIRHEHATRFKYDLDLIVKPQSARAGKFPIPYQLATAPYKTANAQLATEHAIDTALSMWGAVFFSVFGDAGKMSVFVSHSALIRVLRDTIRTF